MNRRPARNDRIATFALATGMFAVGGLGASSVAASVAADEGLKHGIGAAYSGSTIDFDVDRGGQCRSTFDGLGVFGKFGITDRWAVLASYRDLEDKGDLDPWEEVCFRLIDVHASYTWLVTQNSRWHVKAGLASLQFESHPSPGGTVEDSAVTPSVGAGFEWGARRVSLFVDFALGFPIVNLRPEGSESLVVGNTRPR